MRGVSGFLPACIDLGRSWTVLGLPKRLGVRCCSPSSRNTRFRLLGKQQADFQGKVCRVSKFQPLDQPLSLPLFFCVPCSIRGTT